MGFTCKNQRIIYFLARIVYSNFIKSNFKKMMNFRNNYSKMIENLRIKFGEDVVEYLNAFSISQPCFMNILVL